MERIISKDNPRVKRIIRLLSDKGERESSALFVTEGVKLCIDAAISGVDMHSFYVTEQAIKAHPELYQIAEKSRETYIISEPVALKISDAKSSQGVVAVCEKREHKRPEIYPEQARYLILSSLQDPGNVGTIIRTAEAFGLDGVIMSSDSPDLYSPKVLRSTMGGAFRLPVWITQSVIKEIEDLRRSKVKVYASVLEAGAEKLGDMRFEGACAVVLGNEGAGLNKEVIESCDSKIMIPMAGRANSLGVAMAAGIIAWEMKR